jgi:hypothetical protein
MSGLPEKGLRKGFLVARQRPARQKPAPREPAGRTALRLAALFPLWAVLLISCATVPSSREASRWIGVLLELSSDSAYASVDVASSRALVQILFESAGAETAQLEKIVDSLGRVHAGIRLSAGGEPEFALVALGRLSPTAVAFKLNNDSRWQRVLLEPFPDSGFAGSRWSYRTYWRHLGSGVQLAVPQRGVLLVAGGDAGAAEQLLRRFQLPGPNPLPEPAAEEAERADIFLYLPDPMFLAASSRSVSSSSQDPAVLLQRLPLRHGWVSAQGGQEGYELEAVFVLSEVESSRSVELLLRLMLTLWMRKARVQDPVEKLKAVTIRTERGAEPQQGAVRIESLALSHEEIASFFRTLLPEGGGSGGQP